jgi:hypothetical protein
VGRREYTLSLAVAGPEEDAGLGERGWLEDLGVGVGDIIGLGVR